MKPKTWQILSLFQNFSNSVTGSAVYASIALLLVFYFVPKQTSLFELLKQPRGRILTFEIMSGDLRFYHLPSIYDTELFTSYK